MAITPSNGSFTPETQQSAGSSGITTSGSYTPTANAEILVVVQIRGDSGAITGSPTLTTTGDTTFSLKNTALVNDFGNDDTQYVFSGTADASPTGGTLTFTMPGAETHSSLIIGVIELAGASGYDAGNEAEDQTGSGGASDPYTITYPGTFNTGNVLVAIHGGFSDGHTQAPGSASWTEIFDANITGTQGLAAFYATTSQSTSDSDFGSTTGARLGFITEAIDAGGGGGGATTRGLINGGLINAGLINNGLF